MIAPKNDQFTIFTIIRSIGRFTPESDMIVIVNKRVLVTMQEMIRDQI